MNTSNRNIGSFRSMIYNIDKNVRKIVFALNQVGYHTFTSDEGKENERLPKIGIVLDSIKEIFDIIAFINLYNKNIWYEISNRWYKENDEQEKEIDYSDDINLSEINSALRIQLHRCYFLVIKAKTLNELDDFVTALINHDIHKT